MYVAPRPFKANRPVCRINVLNHKASGLDDVLPIQDLDVHVHVPVKRDIKRIVIVFCPTCDFEMLANNFAHPKRVHILHFQC